MRSANGAALRYEVESESLKHLLAVFDKVSRTGSYSELSKRIPSCHLEGYFKYSIKKEIFPYIRQACVIRWHERNGKPIPDGERCVSAEAAHILAFLGVKWDFSGIDIVRKRPAAANTMADNIKGIKDIVKNTLRGANGTELPPRALKGRLRNGYVACHYAEGFDYSRRNDICWFPGSGIDPERVLIYFTSTNNQTGKPITRQTILRLEDEGFRWVALRRDIVVDGNDHFWSPGAFRGRKAGCRDRDPISRWTEEKGNALLKEVHYWDSFFREFGVVMNYVTEEGFARNIAQAIALDPAGISVGKQRSEVYSISSSEVGYHPNDVFFAWNVRTASYLSPVIDYIDSIVISGYPYGIGKERSEDPAKEMRSCGVKFVVALFDNVCFPFNPYSRTEMAALYKAMLQWVLHDESVGLVIKSKKPEVIDALPEIKDILKKAMDTGRCVRLERERGRFPTDASGFADMAVGAGISSAVMESVIAGRRGIHYDMTRLASHEFYGWGRDRLIFDDLGKMIEALKMHVSGSDNGLGDWSRFYGKIDPYRDGKGGQRMGEYMRWALESLDSGGSRDEAICYADGLYRKEWGDDKIIKMERKYAQA